MTGEHLARCEGWPSKPWIARLHQLQLRLPLVARHFLHTQQQRQRQWEQHHHIIRFSSPNNPTHHHHHHLHKEDAATPFSQTLVGCAVTHHHQQQHRHKGSFWFGLVSFPGIDSKRRQAVTGLGSVRKAAAKYEGGRTFGGR